MKLNELYNILSNKKNISKLANFGGLMGGRSITSNSSLPGLSSIGKSAPSFSVGCPAMTTGVRG